MNTVAESILNCLMVNYRRQAELEEDLEKLEKAGESDPSAMEIYLVTRGRVEGLLLALEELEPDRWWHLCEMAGMPSEDRDPMMESARQSLLPLPFMDESEMPQAAATN